MAWRSNFVNAGGPEFQWQKNLQARLPMVIGSRACAVAVASSAVSCASRSDRLAMVPGKSRTLRRATYCSSMWSLLRKIQPLQLGIGLGEREHGRLTRRNRLDLSVREFLAADNRLA